MNRPAGMLLTATLGAALLGASLGLLVPAPGVPLASQPHAAHAAPTTDARSPAPQPHAEAVVVGPSAAELLAEACHDRAALLLDLMGENFQARVHPPFVIVGDLPPHRLDAYVRDSVLLPAHAMWRQYFDRRPQKPISILLFTDTEGYRLWTTELFGRERPGAFGHYNFSHRSVLANMSTGSGTLVHELTHALLLEDFPTVPDWLNEGLASLHEQCRISSTGIVGLVNWRLPELLHAVQTQRLNSLEALITGGDFYGPHARLHYAQARYFCQYLQDRGLLEEVYRRVRDAAPLTEGGLAEVLDTCGMTVEQLDEDFVEWVDFLRMRLAGQI